MVYCFTFLNCQCNISASFIVILDDWILLHQLFPFSFASCIYFVYLDVLFVFLPFISWDVEKLNCLIRMLNSIVLKFPRLQSGGEYLRFWISIVQPKIQFRGFSLFFSFSTISWALISSKSEFFYHQCQQGT